MSRPTSRGRRTEKRWASCAIVCAGVIIEFSVKAGYAKVYLSPGVEPEPLVVEEKYLPMRVYSIYARIMRQCRNSDLEVNKRLPCVLRCMADRLDLRVSHGACGSTSYLVYASADRLVLATHDNRP